MLSSYLPFFLENTNFTIDEFWDMTPYEINLYTTSASNRKKHRLQEQAQMDFLLARTIAANVSGMFSKNATPLELEDIYGSLFEDEGYVEAKQKALEEAQTARIKAQMLAYATQHNERRKKQKKG